MLSHTPCDEELTMRQRELHRRSLIGVCLIVPR